MPDGLPVGVQLDLGLSFLRYAETERYDKEVQRLRAAGYDSVAVVFPAGRWRSAKTDESFKHIAERDLANGWMVVWLGEDPIDRHDLDRLCGEPPHEGSLAIGLHLLSVEGALREPRNPLSQLWRRLLPDGKIPFERVLRRRFFADAFKELEEEIGLWQRLMTAEPEGRKEAARYWINTRPVFEDDPG